MTDRAAAEQDPTEGIAERYLRFARVETDGISPIYSGWSRAVADHRDTLEFLATLPPPKQQPNLLFAAFRAVATEGSGASVAGLAEPDVFLALLHTRLDEVRAVMLSRSNQMNEPGRCGVTLPLLAGIDGPISLIEAGASGGLCLIPDRYRYRWQRSDGSVVELGDGHPEIALSVTGPMPEPLRVPEIVWRAGLDLHPIDLGRPDHGQWLRSLIWPEHDERRQRLDAAIETLAADPPRLVAGNVLHDLADLVAEAPTDTTVVVVHSAVLAYLPGRVEIDRFARIVTDLGVRWISNEAPGVFPEANRPYGDQLGRDFSLMVDGRPVAAAGPHGQSLRWFGDQTGRR